MNGKARRIGTAITTLAAFWCMIATSAAVAGGFFLPQQSVKGVGRAFAAGSAIADDASTIFSNPAGMTRLPGSEFVAGASVLLLDLSIADQGSSASLAAAPVTVPLNQRNATDAIDPALVPGFYASFPVADDEVWLGFAITSPFGISVDYGKDWFGRYDSVKAKLRTINLSPSFAWKLSSAISVGAGVDIQFANASLDFAVPNTFPGVPGLFSVPVFSPSTDGLSQLDGDSWAVGFNVGVLLTPLPGTRVGVHYRSGIDQDVEGDFRVSGLAGPLSAANGTRATTVRIRLPNVASLGVVQDLRDDLRVMGEVQWFGWSRFEELRFDFGDGTSQSRNADYRDTWTAAIAVEYTPSENWTLRSGFRYDPTPTRDATRDTIVPDATTYWLGFGASYRTPGGFDIDVAYAHTFFERSEINVTRSAFPGTPLAGNANIKGQTENSGSTISVGFVWPF